MRRLAVVLVLALAAPLGGCGKSDDQEGTTGGPAVTAETIATNDVTAIDAVTGEAANIAADVVLDANLLAEANGSSNAATADRARRPSGAPVPARPRDNPPAEANDSAPAPEPQSNIAE
jgi:hypothetical protein